MIFLAPASSMQAGSWTELLSGTATAIVAVFAAWVALRAFKSERGLTERLLSDQMRQQASRLTWRCEKHYANPDPRDTLEDLVPFQEDLSDFDGYGHPYPEVFDPPDTPHVFVVVRISNLGQSHLVGATIMFWRDRERTRAETRKIALIPVGESSVAFAVMSTDSQTANQKWEDLSILRNSFVGHIEFRDDYGRRWRRLGTGELALQDSP